MVTLILFTGMSVRAEQSDAEHFKKVIRPMLDKYCWDCHDPEDEDSESPFLLAQTLEDVSKMRRDWKHVSSQLSNRAMPPKRKKNQPTEPERLMLVNWIHEYLKKSALDMPPYAGWVTTRRLNRDAYNNTIRDLVGVDFGFDHRFPVDGSGGEGFNNNGETLFLPPLLMERYFESAEEILERVIITPPLKEKINPAQFKPQATDKISSKENQPDTYPLHIGKETYFILPIYTTENYDIQLNGVNPKPGSARLVLKIDDLVAHRFDLRTKQPGEKWNLSTTLKLSRGLHKFSLHYLKGNQPLELTQCRISSERKDPDKQALENHNNIFQYGVGKSGQPAQELRSLGRKTIHAFAQCAFRRPVTDSEVDRLMQLYDRGAERNDPFEECVKLALTSVLISPDFLFMVEAEPAGQKIEKLGQYELATRLSYFLWSSMPDEELFKLAQTGKLHDDKVLEAQVTRMLKDDKAKSFFELFTGQWLGTREVGGRIAPVGDQKKQGYTSELGFAMRDEPVHLLEYIFQNNRPLTELIDADYVMINEILARHYNINDVKGKQYRVVKLNTPQRGGVLGLGAVHMATSMPNRTSPVLRGAWVHETLLGTHVPSPPDNIPALNTKSKQARKQTLRETFEAHRNQPTCVTCHQIIDPIGFGLENYDYLGKWREKENGRKINVKAALPDGTEFNGPRALKQVLLKKKKDEFIRHFIAKVLGYALGRSLLDEDQGTIERLHDQLKQSDYKAQALIVSIVKSTPFKNKQPVVRKDE